MAVLVSSLAEDTDLPAILQQLKVPENFRKYGDNTDAEIIVRLEKWRRKTYIVLADFKTRLQEREVYTLEQQADIISVIAPLCEEYPWTTESTRQLAKDVLAVYTHAPLPLIEHILSQKIKPVFQYNTHPDVDASTGRKLPRSMGGATGYQDHFDDQVWKGNVGIVDLLVWCVCHTETSMYQRLWHLVIPPVMTLLDDYEVSYKLQGVQVVAEMLKKVPAEILRRTGVDTLLFTNLTKCIAFLDRPQSAALLRAVVPTCISLVQLTTPPRSNQRFDQLCSLLGDGIIGTVWIHGMRAEDVVLASVDVLPSLFKVLGIGCARYLKALIPQLVHPLIPGPSITSVTTPSIQTSSALALCVIIQECSARMHIWKGTILNGVCRCWVTLVESGSRSDDSLKLEKALQEACASLAQACPSILEEEFPRLLQTDEKIFKPLVVSRVSDPKARC